MDLYVKMTGQGLWLPAFAGMTLMYKAKSTRIL